MSILETFDPIPSTCGLMETEPKRAADCAATQLEMSHRQNARFLPPQVSPDSTEFRIITVDADLRSALEHLVPLTMGITTRHLFLHTTQPGWTAYFNNCKLPGSDTNIIRIVSTELKVRAILAIRRDETIAQIDQDTWSGFYGAYRFCVFNGSMEPERSVEMVHYEDGWTFQQTGKPYSFEHLQKYSARRKRDRFDGYALEEYLSAMNLYPYHDDFYRVDQSHAAYVVERVDKNETLKKRIYYFSLEESHITRRTHVQQS